MELIQHLLVIVWLDNSKGFRLCRIWLL